MNKNAAIQEFITRKLRKALKRGESSAEHDNTMKSQEEEMRYLCKEYISDSSQAQESDYVIQMHGLRKEYGNDRRSMPWVKSKKTVALQGNWFGVKKGKYILDIFTCRRNDTYGS